jgi:hypothetical protein
MLSGVDYLDPVAESTVWSQTPPNPALPDLPRRDELLQQDDADLSDQMRSLSLEYPSLTETTFVQCRTMIHTFPIRSIKSPEQLSPSVFSFAVDTEPRRFVGEVKADIGTLVSYFSEEPPSTAELVRIADLDFSTQQMRRLVRLNKQGKIGQFSDCMMKLLRKNTDMTLVLWIIREEGVARRIGAGQITRQAWTHVHCTREDWVILG